LSLEWRSEPPSDMGYQADLARAIDALGTALPYRGARLALEPPVLSAGPLRQVEGLLPILTKAWQQVLLSRFRGSIRRMEAWLKVPTDDRNWYDDVSWDSATGFARPDLVIDRSDRPWLVEPNVTSCVGGMAPHDALARCYEASGYSHVTGQRQDSVRLLLEEVRRQADGAVRQLCLLEWGKRLATPATNQRLQHLAQEMLRHDCLARVSSLEAEIDNLQRANSSFYRYFGTGDELSPRERALIRRLPRRLFGRTIIGHPRCENYLSKVALALAHEAADAGLLSAQDTLVLREGVPWTAVLSHETLDLDRVAGERESIMLKPVRGFQGRGIIDGENVPAADWKALVLRLISSDELFVAQTKIDSPQVAVACEGPHVRTGRTDVGVFVFGGRARAAIARFTEGTNRVIKRGVLAPCWILT